MKNILLISMCGDKYYNNAGVSQLAGYLRKRNFTVDTRFYNLTDDLDDIFTEIQSEYQFYGFSINRLNNNRMLSVASRVKMQYPSGRIVFGGPFATSYYAEIMQENTFVDYIVLGDGEIPLETLLNGDEGAHTWLIQQGDYNDTPEPYTNQSVDWEMAYDFFKVNQNPFTQATLFTKSNTCSGKCTFCCTKKSNDYVLYPIESIVNKISILNDRYHVRWFNITDDNITDPGTDEIMHRLYQICEQIAALNRNLLFTCNCTVHSFQDNPFHRKVLAKMKEVGFTTIYVGVESGNEEDLKLYNKRSTVEDNIKIMNLLNSMDIMPVIGFIFFHPYTQPKQVKENFLFLQRIGSYNLRHYVDSFLYPYKNSPIFGKIMKDNVYKDPTDYYRNGDNYIFQDQAVNELADFIRVHFKDNKEFNGIWYIFSL